MPEGKEEKQEFENLFEKIKENFPNLVKKIDIQVQEAQRVEPKKDHTKMHHNKNANS